MKIRELCESTTSFDAEKISVAAKLSGTRAYVLDVLIKNLIKITYKFWSIVNTRIYEL